MNNSHHRERLEEVEGADGETEAEDEGSNIFGQIKLDVNKIVRESGSEVFTEKEVEESEYIEVFVSSDEEEEDEDIESD